ncbi:MAG TPA: 50S ribosomal protein L18 [Clostridiales bacterium]|nr:50S ribosomal protein L18 [Clostridiales bacterium]HPU67580.1 50S ribosomal protein L18 [Clostridiales bacterium]HQA04766.1 50S ribosomal protein L18 [Clostridiales bacterium]HQD72185.1 50S ribosomal protein L18 [Clostridiales bacterium]HXK83448.1 50S ribosomal protein L18 [Clostridiales bacterium]
MVNRPDSNKARIKRHKRVRAKVKGTPECPRLNVFRSLKHIYAQLIDDVNGVTLVSASTVEKGFEGYGGNVEAARKVGKLIAERAAEKNIEKVVFDRGGYIYHGRVKSLAEGAREGGLKF